MYKPKVIKKLLPTTKVILTNYGWLVGDRLARMAIGLYVATKVARYLGPENYGELAYVLSYLAFFQAVVTLGLDVIVIRRLSGAKENHGKILGTTAALRIISGFIGFFTVIVVQLGTDGISADRTLLLALAGGVLVIQAADTIDLWFQSQSQNKKTVLAKLFAYMLGSSIKLILVSIGAGVSAFAGVIAVEALIVALALANAYKSFSTNERWSFDRSTAVSIVREGFPFMLTALSTMIYMRIDQVFIAKYLNSESLGFYAAASLLSSLWHFLPVTLVAALAPHFSKLYDRSLADFYTELGRIFRLFFFIGLIASIVTNIAASFLINQLFGSHYKPAIDILRVHVLTNIFICLGVAQTLWLVNKGLGRLSVYRTLIGAILSVVLNYIFIEKYGLITVAWIAVVAQAGSAVISNAIFAPKIFILQLAAMFQFKNKKNGI